ncbi:beta-ketoacyl-[acyl-carrier-protein] synthase I [Marinicauda pacifica]|jgi:3-oxoacyl-[acyl-carrier-protein] synthase I|uniref:3-oxoacyl-[acyl-carrier-protein] synthase 1 n=1 Tax=Marinicauda pacifica TaxID=1133559 RepID=A0A4S2H9K1_9PROT|nr:beta-ketoacyl-ACP synthase I [Marinicauda pacifica]TGY92540.1 beta-ketoacyl-ACP synthase I [Marinicauda pacifica]GGE49765.1 beta-ketoacyl-[acyl-carrier-protein] synthase I [Marinicauda pacifica]
MRRVVVTGIGIVSAIGENADAVANSLKAGKSGVVKAQDYADLGFRCQVHARPSVNPAEHVDKRAYRFMGEGSGWCYMSMEQAIADAGLAPDEVSHERTGLIVGTGGPSTEAIVKAADITREKGPKRIGPFAVPKAMCSTASATLATPFKIKGLNYSISSACTTSLHCMGAAAEQIAWGKQDIVFAGGGEELEWSLSNLFDAMGAMSSGYNETPEKASRPFDKNRDGFVIAGGAGIVVLEEYERAKARGATIYAEILGYGATSDGYDMVAPSGEGAARSMKLALDEAKGRTVDYINPHATATPVGDIAEARAIREVFGAKPPLISGTKSMTGHCLGGAGVQEAIYCLLMMRDGFVAPSINIEEMDPEIGDLPVVTETKHQEVNTCLSNSFGFGGTNGTLIMGRPD